MSEPPRDVEGARSYLSSLTDQLTKLIEEGPEVARKATQIEATARSEDGLVEARVGARGNLIALTLDPRIYRRPDTEWLAETIVQTVKSATRDAQEQALEAFSELGDPEQFRPYIEGDPQAAEADIAARMQLWNR